MKQAVIYGLKVWATTVALAPFLEITLRGLVIHDDVLLSFLFWYPRIMLRGVIVSLLSVSILMLPVSGFMRVYTPANRVKLYLTIVSLFTTFLSFYMMTGFNLNLNVRYIMLSYGLITMVSIWFYRLKHTTPQPY